MLIIHIKKEIEAKKMKEKWIAWRDNHANIMYGLKFVGRTILYFLIIMTLIYLYHYKNISGGSFIYNEF